MKIKAIFILLLFAIGVNYAGAAINASAFMKEASDKITSSNRLRHRSEYQVPDNRTSLAQ